ncbi:MAG TPA: nucleoside-diphosphate kinase [Anaerohalosphaeraceae bacterium]|nr:nucleoside-diphosphate kinase [Phycisphaerae bacterium]HOK96408.1 nucleoside-diphosphate kinase [Anaerohalosphaeraceae bacterium]HOL31992.1 nucleoside-diphosphate kinase [Anaerohalosphaeraceae bacterium]HOM76829.1 nucleoside-diphosphate kinase [Anaerohalosphaeraceae bacterium]HPC63652.1 nucleoside-diphosphate kinase [Anaerohalosphaeraceae bacterium]
MPQRTLIIIKPDAVQRQLVGRIISRFEDKGLKIAAAKFMQISEDLARRHYAVHAGKPFFEGVVRYLASSPVLVMVLEGDGVIEMARKLMGKTFGNEAEPGTIRGDFGASRGYNLVHGSDSPESAAYEIGLYFRPDEIVDYSLAAQAWIYGSNE